MRMRRLVPSVMLAWATATLGCADPASLPTPLPEPPPPPPVVQLKDVVITTLPNPYYHFEYDSSDRVKLVSFASGLTNYAVTYQDGRIAQMQNNILVNHDQLIYIYDDSGRVGLVKEVDGTGSTFMIVVFTYDGPKLIGLERDRRVEGGFIIDKTMSFTYDGAGNLSQITEHRPAIPGLQEDATFVDRFEGYDQGINVDGFDLIHNDFFDHLILLPQVQLQNGNPRRETRTGDGLNYVVDYTYTYDAGNRPLSKIGALTILNGPSAGRQIQTSSVFSYY